MGKGWIIFKHELYTVFARPSFWVAALLMPLVSLCLYGGTAWIARSQGQGSVDMTSKLQGLQGVVIPKEDTRPQGYVDQSGVIHLPQPDFTKDFLVAYPDERSAREALAEEKISAYFIIPADYPKTDRIFIYMKEMNASISPRPNFQLTKLLNYNLLDGDPTADDWISRPIGEIRETDLSPDKGQMLLDVGGERGINPKAFMVPYMVEAFMAGMVLAVSGLLLTAIHREHENRTLETLLTSAHPYPFLMGKTAALGLAGLIQLVSWGVSSLLMARWGGQVFSLPELSSLSPDILIWGVLICLAGYLFYGTVMVSIGVLVSGLRDYAAVAAVLSIPMYIPIALILQISKEPNGLVPMLLSFIPFTAPETILVRMMVVRLPFWQPALALLLLLGCGVLGMRITASLFQAQRLMGGSKFYIADWFKWLKKKRDGLLGE